MTAYVRHAYCHQSANERGAHATYVARKHPQNTLSLVDAYAICISNTNARHCSLHSTIRLSFMSFSLNRCIYLWIYLRSTRVRCARTHRVAQTTLARWHLYILTFSHLIRPVLISVCFLFLLGKHCVRLFRRRHVRSVRLLWARVVEIVIGWMFPSSFWHTRPTSRFRAWVRAHQAAGSTCNQTRNQARSQIADKHLERMTFSMDGPVRPFIRVSPSASACAVHASEEGTLLRHLQHLIK